MGKRGRAKEECCICCGFYFADSVYDEEIPCVSRYKGGSPIMCHVCGNEFTIKFHRTPASSLGEYTGIQELFDGYDIYRDIVSGRQEPMTFRQFCRKEVQLRGIHSRGRKNAKRNRVLERSSNLTNTMPLMHAHSHIPTMGLHATGMMNGMSSGVIGPTATGNMQGMQPLLSTNGLMLPSYFHNNAMGLTLPNGAMQNPLISSTAANNSNSTLPVNHYDSIYRMNSIANTQLPTTTTPLGASGMENARLPNAQILNGINTNNMMYYNNNAHVATAIAAPLVSSTSSSCTMIHNNNKHPSVGTSSTNAPNVMCNSSVNNSNGSITRQSSSFSPYVHTNPSIQLNNHNNPYITTNNPNTTTSNPNLTLNNINGRYNSNIPYRPCKNVLLLQGIADTIAPMATVTSIMTLNDLLILLQRIFTILENHSSVNGNNDNSNNATSSNILSNDYIERLSLIDAQLLESMNDALSALSKDYYSVYQQAKATYNNHNGTLVSLNNNGDTSSVIISESGKSIGSESTRASISSSGIRNNLYLDNNKQIYFSNGLHNDNASASSNSNSNSNGTNDEEGVDNIGIDVLSIAQYAVGMRCNPFDGSNNADIVGNGINSNVIHTTMNGVIVPPLENIPQRSSIISLPYPSPILNSPTHSSYMRHSMINNDYSSRSDIHINGDSNANGAAKINNTENSIGNSTDNRVSSNVNLLSRVSNVSVAENDAGISLAGEGNMSELHLDTNESNHWDNNYNNANTTSLTAGSNGNINNNEASFLSNGTNNGTSYLINGTANSTSYLTHGTSNTNNTPYLSNNTTYSTTIGSTYGRNNDTSTETVHSQSKSRIMNMNLIDDEEKRESDNRSEHHDIYASPIRYPLSIINDCINIPNDVLDVVDDFHLFNQTYENEHHPYPSQQQQQGAATNNIIRQTSVSSSSASPTSSPPCFAASPCSTNHTRNHHNQHLSASTNATNNMNTNNVSKVLHMQHPDINRNAVNDIHWSHMQPSEQYWGVLSTR